MALLSYTTVPGLAAATAQLSASSAPRRALLFVSGTDSETGLSWCPDCRRAQPAVERAAASAGAALLVVDVGDKPGWKSAEHPFRTDSALALTCIPTLLAWDGGSAGARLAKELEDVRSKEASARAGDAHSRARRGAQAKDESEVEALCAAFWK